MAEAARQEPTLRQERLAAILTDTKNPPKSRADALIRAGYSKATAYGNATRQIELAGTQLAVVEKANRRSDKARGVERILALTLDGGNVEKAIGELEARDMLALGLQAYKLKHELGVEPEQGDADVFKAWLKDYVRSRFPRWLAVHNRRKRPESQLDSEHNHDVIEVTATSVET